MRARLVTAIAEAIDDTLRSAHWLAALGDDDRRTWLLVRSVCDALAGAGVAGAPTRQELVALLERMLRDEQIGQQFDGRNYAALATKHHVSVRTVRRIVERERRRTD